MKQRSCEVCGTDRFRHLFSKESHEFYRCLSCGLIRLDPQPTDATLAGIYGTKYYDAWGVAAGAARVFELKKATFRKHVLPLAGLKPGARALDCGAAFGALMSVVKEMGAEPYGIELASEAAAEIAEHFGPDRVFSGPFEQARFSTLGEAAFDAVFMCDFIEHVRDPLAVLQKATALLARKGRLLLTTPDGGSWSCRLMGAGWPHYKVEHLHYFNRHNIASLLKKVGVTVTRAERAWKVLDLAYLQSQFSTYPRPFVTPVVNFLAKASRRLRTRPMSLSLGEMVIVGVKQ